MELYTDESVIRENINKFRGVWSWWWMVSVAFLLINFDFEILEVVTYSVVLISVTVLMALSQIFIRLRKVAGLYINLVIFIIFLAAVIYTIVTTEDYGS